MISVDSVLTQNSSKSRDFSIAPFGRINQACSYGDTWVWMKRFFNIGSVFGIIGQTRLRRKERNQNWSNWVFYKNTKDWDLAAKSQVSGYGELVVGIGEKSSRSLPFVWRSWTNNIPIETTKSFLLETNLPLQLRVGWFRFSWKKLHW